MGMSPKLPCHSQAEQGLTLIEVLIALAIIGIAMTAIIQATTQTIRHTAYLQNKTIALWVGERVLNEARLDLITLPDAPDKRKQMLTMLGQDWYWQAGQEVTANKRIYKITVDVFTQKDEKTPVISLESYRYHAD